MESVINRKRGSGQMKIESVLNHVNRKSGPGQMNMESN